MAGDPKGQCYARKDKTANANDRICDIVGAKRRKLFVSGEIRKEGTDDRDWISNLPQDVVQCILERLSVHDAATTSVLSKEWRYKWGMINNLVLDELFFLKLISNKDKNAYESAFSRAIEMIMLVHKGPLLSFNLYIPPKLDRCLVSRWMEHFLNKSIRALEISSSEKNAYEIPLFVCEGLVELKLTTGILNTSPKPGTFTNLIKVRLSNVSITADITFGSQLKELYLRGCTGIQYLGCQFTNDNNLTRLILQESEQIEWRWFEYTKQLKRFGLALTKAYSKPIYLIKLLSNTPTISHIVLTGYTVEVSEPLNPMKGVAPNIESLVLTGLRLQNFRQFFRSLCLIICLRNLQILWIILEPEILDSLNLPVKQFLEAFRWKGLLLNQLHTVVIQGVVGETTVIHFIKFLLSSSPSLRVMSLSCNIKANAHEEIWKIRQELQQCPRKSSVAKLYVSFLPVDEATNVIAQQNPGVDEPILPPPVDEATNVIAQQNIEVDELTLPPLVSITQGKRQLAKKKTQGKRYRECWKNHAVGQGGHVLDGCLQFVPAGDDALKCSACSCHRSFHRQEDYFVPYPPGYLHMATPTSQRPLALPLSCGGGVSSLEENMTSSGGLTRKRHRSKFTREQKEKMVSLAERLGWRIQEKDDDAVKSFCEETGVSRQVFKHWIKNNKGKKP